MTEFTLDSEYNAHHPLCFAFTSRDGREWIFDTREGEDTKPLADFLEEHAEATFIAYNIRAEISSLCRLGVPVPATWIDLLPEVVQIVGTHERFLQWTRDDSGKLYPFSPKSFRLTDALRHLTDVQSDFDKAEMYTLILSRNDWTPAELLKIFEYCLDDARVLWALWDAIKAFHADVRSPWTMKSALYRGRCIRAAAVMQHSCRGIPVDTTWIAKVYASKREILAQSVKDIEAKYGFPLYRMNGDAASVDLAQCAAFARHWGIPWRITATGKTSMQKDYIEQLSQEDRSDLIDAFGESCPSLKDFKSLRDLERNLSKNPWLEGDPKRYEPPLVQNGYVPIAEVVASATVTGRSKMLRSHLQNQTPLFRTMICGNDEEAYIGADWSQQEIVLALHYFPDARLREAFEKLPPRFEDDPKEENGEYYPLKRDIYTNLAIMAGAINPTMPYSERRIARQGFKSVQLGVGYGMAAAALGRKLFADINAGKDKPVITLREAMERAQTILKWHKRTFREYWKGVARFVTEARRTGHYVSCDGWVYFVHRHTKSTQLQNLRMQCNGAAMMRRAILECEKRGLQFVAEHHDAIYITAPHDEMNYREAQLVDVMNEASTAIIGNDLKISVDIKHFGKGEQYSDTRADALKQLIEEKLNNE